MDEADYEGVVRAKTYARDAIEHFESVRSAALELKTVFEDAPNDLNDDFMNAVKAAEREFNDVALPAINKLLDEAEGVYADADQRAAELEEQEG